VRFSPHALGPRSSRLNIGEIGQVEVIAEGSAIRGLARLRRVYGPGRWRKLKRIATVRLSSGRVRLAELDWCQAHGIGKREMKRKRYLDPGRRMKKSKEPSPQFAVCVDNVGYPALLELHRIYRVLPDAEAGRDGDLRIVDESGEDYLYAASRFSHHRAAKDRRAGTAKSFLAAGGDEAPSSGI